MLICFYLYLVLSMLCLKMLKNMTMQESHFLIIILFVAGSFQVLYPVGIA